MLLPDLLVGVLGTCINMPHRSSCSVQITQRNCCMLVAVHFGNCTTISIYTAYDRMLHVTVSDQRKFVERSADGYSLDA